MSIRQAVVLEEDLPDFAVFDDGTFGYRIRYRVLAEDFNTFSHYSPIFNVRANYRFERPSQKQLSDISIVRIGPYINVVWEAARVKDRINDNTIKIQNRYNMWFKWDRGETNGVWSLANTIDGTLQALVVPASYPLQNGTVVSQEPNRLSVEIYAKTLSPSRSYNNLLIYKLDNQDVALPTPIPGT
jgi:hypothetical protein